MTPLYDQTRHIGDWHLVDGLFIARFDSEVEESIGLSTSYWSYKVEDLGPRVLVYPSWLQIFSHERETAQALVTPPPDRAIEAELFHLKLSARLGPKSVVEVQLAAQEQLQAALAFTRWLSRQGLVIANREALGGLGAVGEIKVFIHHDRDRGFHHVQPEANQYRYEANFQSGLSLLGEMKKAPGHAHPEFHLSADDHDLMRALGSLEIAGAMVARPLSLEFTKFGSQLSVHSGSLDMRPNIALAHQILNVIDRVAQRREKENQRRARGEVSSENMEAVRAAIAESAQVFTARTSNERIEARLKFEELELDGNLSAEALDLDAKRLELVLEAVLPPGPEVRLRTPGGGLVDWVMNRFDDKTGNNELDARFLLEKTTPEALAELERDAVFWLALGPCEAEVGARELVLRATPLADDAAALAAAFVALWRGISRGRVGAEISPKGPRS